MILSELRYIALPVVEIDDRTGPACDIAVGVHESSINGALSAIHRALHETLFKGSFVDTEKTSVKVDWDIHSAPSLHFAGSEEGRERLAAMIRESTPSFLDQDAAAEAVSALRNLTLEVAVPDLHLSLSNRKQEKTSITLNCTLFAYVSLTSEGELGIAPFDAKVSFCQSSSQYEVFVLALINMFVPDLLIGKLAPILNNLLGAKVLELPEIAGVSFGFRQLFFQNGFLALAASVKRGKGEPEPGPMRFAAAPKNGVFSYASYAVANVIGKNALPALLDKWSNQKGGKWAGFSWALAYDAWVGNLLVSAPVEDGSLCEIAFGLMAQLKVSAKALFIKARVDGSLSADSGAKMAVNLQFREVQQATGGTSYDVDCTISKLEFSPRVNWHVNIPGLGGVLSMLSNMLTIMLDLVTIFKNSLNVTVARNISLSRSVPIAPKNFVGTLIDPKLVTAETGVLFTAGMTFAESDSASN